MRAVGASVVNALVHKGICLFWNLRYRFSVPTPVHYYLEMGAVKPQNAHIDDGCYDVVATSTPEITYLPDGSINVRYDTGVRLALPMGWHTLVFPRSSITKTGLILGNSVGYADNGYRGTLMVSFKYLGSKEYLASNPDMLPKPGDRIAQITFVQSPKTIFFKADTAKQLPTSYRGDKGWGSTGKN